MSLRMLLALVPLSAALVLFGPAPAPQAQGPRVPPLPREARRLWERALGEGVVNPSPAILVSRYRFSRLRRPRSWQDLAALRDYLAWADRPEAAGFHSGIVDADVSSGDLILLRIPAARVRAPIPVFEDPIGFAVLDPLRSGRLRIPVTLRDVRSRMPDVPFDFPLRPVPAIHAAVEEAAGVVVIYGESLDGRRVSASCREGPAVLLYKSAVQINARAERCSEIAVAVDGLRSEWRKVRR